MEKAVSEEAAFFYLMDGQLSADRIPLYIGYLIIEFLHLDE